MQQFRDCCPAANRVLPPDYATANKATLDQNSGAFCCPNNCQGAAPAGGWAWWISADRTQRCCPRNFLLGPSGALTTQPTPPTDDKYSFLCCRGDATGFAYTPLNAIQTYPAVLSEQRFRETGQLGHACVLSRVRHVPAALHWTDLLVAYQWSLRLLPC